MGSLLQRASRYRDEQRGTTQWRDSSEPVAELQTLGSVSAKDEDEAREIEQEIEERTRRQRLEITPELFRVQPRRKRFWLAAVVNLAAILVLAGGIWGAILLFESQEESRQAEVSLLSSTEGRILAAVREEAEASLAQAEAEIQNAQSQLAQIAAERNALAQDFASRIADREAQLAAELQAQLEAERQRLQGAGLSETQINAELAAFEAQQQQQFDAQLESFRQEAAAEREALEANLNSLESELAQAIDQANAERQRLIQDAAAREAELLAELEAQQQQSATELTAAQAELQRLAAQRDRSASLQQQITGFYASTRRAVNEENYDQALEQLDLLDQFLIANAGTDAVADRQGIDRFLIASLRSRISSEANRQDTTEILETVTVVTEIRNAVAEAQDFAQAGATAQAEERYLSALQTLPELRESLAFVEGQRAEETAQSIDRIRADLQARVSDLEAQLADRDQQIDGLTDLTASLQEQVAEQILTLEEREARIAELETSLAQQADALAAVEDSLAQAETRARDLEAALGDARLSGGSAAQTLEWVRELLSRVAEGNAPQDAVPDGADAQALAEDIAQLTVIRREIASRTRAATLREVAEAAVAVQQGRSPASAELRQVLQPAFEARDELERQLTEVAGILAAGLDQTAPDTAGAAGAEELARAVVSALEEAGGQLSAEQREAAAAADQAEASARAAGETAGELSALRRQNAELRAQADELADLQARYEEFQARAETLLASGGALNLVNFYGEYLGFLGGLESFFPGLGDDLQEFGSRYEALLAADVRREIGNLDTFQSEVSDLAFDSTERPLDFVERRLSELDPDDPDQAEIRDFYLTLQEVLLRELDESGGAP